MADERNRDEPAPPAEKAFSDRHRNLLMVCVVGVLMVIEGVGMIVAVKYVGGGPEPAGASDGSTGEGDGEGAGWIPEHTELPVTNLMAFNSQNGRVFVYQMSVYADVEAKSSEKVRELFEARQNTIDDRLSKIIRAADPKYLDEAGLETLRRQFKHELDQVLGDEALIKQVLFPEFSKSRAD
jgi:flagellar basal body-associated protein FliL